MTNMDTFNPYASGVVYTPHTQQFFLRKNFSLHTMVPKLFSKLKNLCNQWKQGNTGGALCTYWYGVYRAQNPCSVPNGSIRVKGLFKLGLPWVTHV